MTHSFSRVGNVKTTMELNHEAWLDQVTVAIVGTPRGGTTMVAAVVDALGVDLGPREDLNKFHFEDQTMHSPYLDVQYQYIQKRNREHGTWGWKDPVGVTTVTKLAFALRNPRVIFVIRDVLATIQAEMRFDEVHCLGPKRSFLSLLDQTEGWTVENIEYMRRAGLPTLLVSYERAMICPDLFVTELAVFLGIEQPMNKGLVEECLSRIGPAGGYLINDGE